jgi:type IV pilus assembly protein PilM
MRNSMGGGMMGGGMGGGMMGGGAGAVKKGDVTFLTRTDFLLQFVWVPVKPDAQPKTPEELKTKLEDIATKLAEAEKAFTADPQTAKLEEAIEAESKKKSKAIDSALDKAFGAANPAAGAVPPAGGGANIPPPPAGVAPKGGAPTTK